MAMQMDVVLPAAMTTEAEALRANLRAAFVEARQDPVWQEWLQDDPTAPQWVRASRPYTVLVNRIDVLRQPALCSTGCCAPVVVLDSTDALPDVETIARALRHA
ncbi:MAG: hypothetical protein ACO376_04485 [Gammaproteobacteria bacterium]